MRLPAFTLDHPRSFTKSPFVIKFAILISMLTSIAIAGFGQTYKVVYTFPATDAPYSNLVQGLDGNLYGTTQSGGAHGKGTVYKLTPGGTLTTIYSFCSLANCADGAGPSSLILGSNGNFYGTTGGGGTGAVGCGAGCGTLFKLTPKGILTTLHNFCSAAPCEDGAQPYTALVEGTDANFYGTTPTTPRNGGSSYDGAVYRITPTGAFTTLYSFCPQGNCGDGGGPISALTQGTNGQFYGVTSAGGANGLGGIFEIASNGTLSLRYSFDGLQNSTFYSQLLQANNGNFYGMMQYGGTNGCDYNYQCGALYEMTPSGGLSTLVNFDGSDGSDPLGGFVEGGNGDLYGLTMTGGANDGGIIFKMTPSGTLATLHDFCAINCTNGYYPSFGIYQATNGLFYGIAYSGEQGATIVFSFSTGLKPFVDTLPTSGKVGTKVTILGNNLTGSTAVAFNGTPAAFTVVSSTEIATTVPAGATSGKVEVTTPTGMLSTTIKFRVP